MTKQQAQQWFNTNGLNVDTLSFYTDECGDDVDDTEYGVCDISNKRCMVVTCTCLDDNRDIVELQISEDLVGGVVGKLAGAF